MSGESPTYGEWQPIETAPKSGEDILLGLVDTPPALVGSWNSREEFWAVNGRLSDFCVFPTHWMPLPEPPA
jgi:hypothetical protein